MAVYYYLCMLFCTHVCIFIECIYASKWNYLVIGCAYIELQLMLPVFQSDYTDFPSTNNVWLWEFLHLFQHLKISAFIWWFSWVGKHISLWFKFPFHCDLIFDDENLWLSVICIFSSTECLFTGMVLKIILDSAWVVGGLF